MSAPIERLTIITREDLSAGQQAVQGIHAAIEFVMKNPVRALRWFLKSNTIAFVTLPNEGELGVLLKKAEALDVASAGFTEPDRNNELTAVAVAPEGAVLTKHLPLALKNHRR